MHGVPARHSARRHAHALPPHPRGVPAAGLRVGHRRHVLLIGWNTTHYVRNFTIIYIYDIDPLRRFPRQTVCPITISAQLILKKNLLNRDTIVQYFHEITSSSDLHSTS